MSMMQTFRDVDRRQETPLHVWETEESNWILLFGFFFFSAFWFYKMFASSPMRLLLLLLALSRSHCHAFLTMTERVSSKHERHLD